MGAGSLPVTEGWAVAEGRALSVAESRAVRCPGVHIHFMVARCAASACTATATIAAMVMERAGAHVHLSLLEMSDMLLKWCGIVQVMQSLRQASCAPRAGLGGVQVCCLVSMFMLEAESYFAAGYVVALLLYARPLGCIMGVPSKDCSTNT